MSSHESLDSEWLQPYDASSNCISDIADLSPLLSLSSLLSSPSSSTHSDSVFSDIQFDILEDFDGPGLQEILGWNVLDEGSLLETLDSVSGPPHLNLSVKNELPSIHDEPVPNLCDARSCAISAKVPTSSRSAPYATVQAPTDNSPSLAHHGLGLNEKTVSRPIGEHYTCQEPHTSQSSHLAPPILCHLSRSRAACAAAEPVVTARKRKREEDDETSWEEADSDDEGDSDDDFYYTDSEDDDDDYKPSVSSRRVHAGKPTRGPRRVNPPRGRIPLPKKSRLSPRIEKWKPRHPCPICGTDIGRESDLRRHLATTQCGTEQPAQERPFCSSCKKYFSRMDALRRHKHKKCREQPLPRRRKYIS